MARWNRPRPVPLQYPTYHLINPSKLRSTARCSNNKDDDDYGSYWWLGCQQPRALKLHYLHSQRYRFAISVEPDRAPRAPSKCNPNKLHKFSIKVNKIYRQTGSTTNNAAAATATTIISTGDNIQCCMHTTRSRSSCSSGAGRFNDHGGVRRLGQFFGLVRDVTFWIYTVASKRQTSLFSSFPKNTPRIPSHTITLITHFLPKNVS